jgi:ribose transport system substrate-binding protein
MVSLRRFPRFLVTVCAFALIAAACGGDDDGGSGTTGGSDTGAATGSETGSTTVVAGDITTMCGTEPMKVGVFDGFGGNSWRKITLAEIEDEASKCPNITDVIYTDGQGDQEKTISNINGLVAQGVNVLIGLPDFGPALLPALRAATEAGVSVVPYLADPGGTAGEDYVVFIDEDRAAAGGEWAKWVGENFEEGNAVFLGGVPGNPSSQAFFDGLREALQDYPNITLLNDAPIDTNWDPAETQRVMAGLFTQYPQIDFIISDYGAGSVGAIRAYENAGKPLVPLATLASNNELGCIWEDNQGEGFELMSLDQTTTFARNALRFAVADYQGLTNPESSVVTVPVFFDSLGDTPPKCEPDLPPDADLSSNLSSEQLAELFAT